MLRFFKLVLVMLPLFAGAASTNLGNFADNFDPAGGTSGSTGSLAWSNSWQLTDRYTRVVMNNGSYQGEFYGNNTDGAYFSRQFKTPAGTSNIIFRYDYISNGGTYQSQYSTNGTSWITLATYSSTTTQTPVAFTSSIPAGVLTTFRIIKTVKGNNSFFFDNVNIVAMGSTTPTASEVLTRAYNSSAGTVIEFETVEEAGSNPIILYLYVNGSWVEAGRTNSVGEGSNRYQFVIPYVKTGDYVGIMVRDDEGIYHTSNLLVGDFTVRLVLMEKNGIWLQWNSIPDRTYYVYRATQLTSPDWIRVATCTAISSVTKMFVSYPSGPSGFFKVQE